MRAVIVMYDSLNRRSLPPYGNPWVHAPNFARLATRAATFENSYICSMPCMPARRDLLTGRPNFLHRPWGPLDPYDVCYPDVLREAGVSSHLFTDHYHYFEDGGANYHCRFSTWEFFRGHEGDLWKGVLDEPDQSGMCGQNASPQTWRRQDLKNRRFITRDDQMPQAQTFRAGLEFVRRNAHHQNWVAQIETFDPHEPFFTQRHWTDLYPDLVRQGERPFCDWPEYGPSAQNDAVGDQLRGRYAASVSFCDKHLGDVLDTFDELNLWADTMLIVMTDHGFLLGEHRQWAKNVMPLYDEVANTPFFVWDPRATGCAGQRRKALVQPAIDVAPTLLSLFGVEQPGEMLGHDLAPAVREDAAVREVAMFGYFGQQCDVTDGRYVYMRAPARPDNQPLNQYTLSPSPMRGMARVEKVAQATLAEPFGFTRGCPTLKLPEGRGWPADFSPNQFDTLLFDRRTDPRQETPVRDEAVEARLIEQLRTLMRQAEAPAEQYERLGL